MKVGVCAVADLAKPFLQNENFRLAPIISASGVLTRITLASRENVKSYSA